MPRYSKQQLWPKSCGAATTVVAKDELGVAGADHFSNAQELFTYNRLKQVGGPANNEILPHSIVNDMQLAGLNAQILESPVTGTFLLNTAPFNNMVMQGLYNLYTNSLGLIQKSMQNITGNDLNNNARLFLVVRFRNHNLTHYLLARRDGGQVWIMNPDPGTDEQINLPAAGAPIDTNLGGGGGGRRRYYFMGIAIRVW